MSRLWLGRLRRGFTRPPGEIARRVAFEARAAADRLRGAPATRLDDTAFARLFGADDVEALWSRLAAWPAPATAFPAADQLPEAERARIRTACERAMAREVDLLGSGPVTLGTPIDWHCDIKSGHRWPVAFFRDLDVNDLGRDSDAKLPWELSRLHWLIPVAQDYCLAGGADRARFVRDILDEWIAANPYARGINWAVAMEAAMRVFVWTWLFKVFAASEPWRAPAFRGRFLRALRDHGVYCARYLEDYGYAGNHLVAGLAGLAVLGAFFGAKGPAASWFRSGWQGLVTLLPRQVADHGVNGEASTAYHRLVTELFLWPALWQRALGQDLHAGYGARLQAMAAFTRAYTGPDGLAPAWGDDDGARVLPFGGQEPADHSYLPALVAWCVDGKATSGVSPAAAAEVLWACGTVPPDESATPPASCAFADSGVYIMAGARDHVFIDCARNDAEGRGAHGHNDCLAFEAVLDGIRLVTDAGTYLYTSAPDWRDRFRAAAAHNAPVVDGAEPNRLVPGELFLMRDDAAPEVPLWQPGETVDRFVGTHTGYQRLTPPVRPVRTLVLDKARHRLALCDRFEGEGPHAVSVTLHFAHGTAIRRGDGGRWRIDLGDAAFELVVGNATDWAVAADESWVSPRYGVKRPRPAIGFTRMGPLAPLALGLYPAHDAPADPSGWLADILAA